MISKRWKNCLLLRDDHHQPPQPKVVGSWNPPADGQLTKMGGGGEGGEKENIPHTYKYINYTNRIPQQKMTLILI